jgi:hypothetical protein
MNAALAERWAKVEDVAGHLFPGIVEGDGDSLVVIDSAERQLGATLPPLLRALYLRCGAREDLLRTYEEVLAPDRLSVADGILVFAVENQGVCKWGLRWPPATDDPPVVRMDLTETPVWEPDHDRLSDFLVWFLLWQAVNGGAPAGANGDADAGVLDRLRGWRELDRTGCHWTHTRFFLRPGQAVCLMGSTSVYVCAAARDDQAFALLDSSVHVDWNYTWPEL